MIRGRKHERIHQCVRCGDFDEGDSWCIPGEKEIHEPKKLRYCAGFKKKRARGEV